MYFKVNQKTMSEAVQLVEGASLAFIRQWFCVRDSHSLIESELVKKSV